MKDMSVYVSEYMKIKRVDPLTLQNRAIRAEMSIPAFVYLELEMDKVMRMQEANLIPFQMYITMIENVLSESRSIDELRQKYNKFH
jgi:hypothetical protein